MDQDWSRWIKWNTNKYRSKWINMDQDVSKWINKDQNNQTYSKVKDQNG